MYYKIKLLVILCCLSSGSILAQNIKLIMSPKPSPYLSDWQSQTETVKLIISNSSAKEIEVKIKTELFDGKGALIANTDDAKMPVLVLSPTSTSTYNPEDIIPSNAINYKGNLEKTAITTGRIPDDNYRLCVTLIDPKSGKPVGTSGTVCNVFTIVAYQAPTLISPTNKEIIKETAMRGIIFRWSPVIPSPKTIVTYRLQVWEVLEGQNNMTALRSNQPIVEKDLKGILQTQWPVDFALPELKIGNANHVNEWPVATLVWTITPLDDEGRKLVEGDGFAEPFEFRVCRCGCLDLPPCPIGNDLQITLVAPSNGEEITSNVTFSWIDLAQVPKDGYTLRIVELKRDQSSDVAIANNPAVIEQKGIMDKSFKLGDSVGKLKDGKKYVWAVKGNNGFAEPFGLTLNSKPVITSQPEAKCISPIPSSPSESLKPKFEWTINESKDDYNFKFRLVKLDENQFQNPVQALRSNSPVLEISDIKTLYLDYPLNTPELETGQIYAWVVWSLKSNHPVDGTVLPMPSKVGIFQAGNPGITGEMDCKGCRVGACNGACVMDGLPPGGTCFCFEYLPSSIANHINEWPTVASANCYYCLKDEQPCLDGESECNLNPISVSHILGTGMEKTHFFTKYQLQNENLVRMIFEKTNTSISPELFEVVFGSGYYHIRENLRLTDWLQKELKMKKDFTIAEGKYPITQDDNLYIVDFPNMQYRATTAACSCKANLPIIETVMCSQQTNWPTAVQLQLSSSFGGTCSGISVVWNPTTPPGVSGTYSVTATRSGISCTRSVRVTILSPSLELCTKPSGLNGNEGCKKMIMLKATDSVCTPGKTKFPVGSKFRYFICRGLASLPPPSCFALPTLSLPVGCFPTLATGNWYKMSNSTLSAGLQIPDLAVNVGTENYWVVCCLELPNGCSGPTLYGPIAFHVNSPVNPLDLRVTSPSPYPAENYHQCCGKRFNLFNNANSTVFNPNNNPVVYTYQWLIKKNNTLDNTPPHCLAEVTNTYPIANPDCPDNQLPIDNRWYKFGGSTSSINAPALPASQPGYSYHVICYVRVSCDVGNKSSAFASAQTFRVEMPNATPIPIINGLHDVCIPSSVTLTGSGYPSTPSGITLSWSPNNGTNTTATFNPNPPQNFRNVRFTYTIPPSNGPGNPYTYGCIVTSDPYRVNFNNCGNTCDQNLVSVSNDRTSFLATVQNAQLIDFSSDYSATPAIPLPYGQAALNNWDWNGISFSDCHIYWTAYLMKGAPDPLTITFPPGLYKKAGFEMSEWIYRDGTNGIYSIKVTSGNCEYVYQVNGGIGQVNYFGISLPNPIDKIQVSRDQVILRLDNFSFGN